VTGRFAVARARTLLLLCATLALAVSLRAGSPVSPDSAAAAAADSAGRRVPVNTARLALVGGVLAGGMAAIHIYQQHGWWADNRTSFHFQEDLTYGLGVDKIGHFHGASFLAFVIGNAVRWADVPDDEALWIGSGGSLLFQTYVEVEDGFSTWGFDRVDFAADVGGAAWPLAQHYVPALQSVNLKMSYRPSSLINNPGGAGFKGQKHLMMDDYEGQTFWLAVQPRSLLPEGARRFWPEFLGLAVGYGARDIAATDHAPYRVLFLSFDYDMTKIVPQSSGFLRTLSRAMNFLHFPAPAVRISPSAVWYGFFF
jgi:hypothetical protein